MKRNRLAVAALVFAIAMIALIWNGTRSSMEEPGDADNQAAAPTRGKTQARAALSNKREPGSVVVVVRSSGSNTSVPGATVQLIELGGSAASGETRLADSEGIARFDTVTAGEYRVTATGSGLAPSLPATVTVVSGDEARVSLVLMSGGNTARGTVSDIGGGPIAGATIQFIPVHGTLVTQADESVATLSDDDGKFEVNVRNGRYRAVAFHPEYVASRRFVELRDGARTVAFRLSPGGVIEGRVLKLPGRTPVEGAIVQYRGSGEGGGVGVATTGREGRYRITGLPIGFTALSAHSAQGATTEPYEVGLGLGETLSDVDLLIEGGGHVAGTVVEFNTKEPLAGADVVLTRGDMELATVVADESGRFRFNNIPPGSARLVARGESILANVLSGVVDVPAGGIDDVVVTARRGYWITGRVEPARLADIDMDLEAKTMEGPMMMLGVRNTRTDPDGTFKFGPVGEGTVPLIARDEAGKTGRAEVDVSSGDVDGVVIHLRAGASVAGRVVNDRGQPARGVYVTAHRIGTAHMSIIMNGVNMSRLRAPTHEDGTYVISGLEAGEYSIAVEASSSPKLGQSDKTRQRVGVRDSQRRDGVDFEIEARDGVIRGVVTLEDGQPAADVWVRASPSVRAGHGPGMQGEDSEDDPENVPEDEQGESSSRTMMVMDSRGSGVDASAVALTDAEGRFTIGNLENGSYDVVCESARGGARGFAKGVSTDTDVAITLHSLRRITGVVTQGDSPVTKYSIEWTRPDSPFPRRQWVRAADGAFALRRVDPGTYTLRVKADGAAGEATVTVSTDKDATANIALDAMVAIRGRLVDEAGAAIAGVLMVVNPKPKDGRMEMSIMIGDGESPPLSDDQGRFVVHAKPGDYVLLAVDFQGGGGPLLVHPIELGRVDLELGDVVAAGIKPPPGNSPPGESPDP